MERYTEYHCGVAVIKDKEKLKDAMEVLATYEDIGLSPEQVQELKERDKEKGPILEGDGYDGKGEIIYDTWICPNCDEHYEVECDDYDFCPKCGQRLKWED